MQDVHIAVLAPFDGGTEHFGALSGPSQARDAEGLFKKLVLDPESAVVELTGDELWPQKHAIVVDALRKAADPKEKEKVKAHIPAIVPGRFETPRRHKDTCLGRQVVMHDFDGVVADTFEEACEHIRAQLPDRFLAIHTTASERDADGWKLRVAEILDREATPDEWETIVKPHMRSLGDHDPRALDVVRLLYMPVRTPGYRAKVYEGPRTRLDELATKVATPKTATPAERKERATPVSASRLRDSAAAALAASWPERGNDRHGAQLALAGALYHDKWKQEDALELLCTVCRQAGDEDRPKREATIRDTWRRGGAGGTIRGWTALSGHVGTVVSDMAKRLLRPDAEAAAEFVEFMGRAPGPAPDTTTPVGDELGVQWGGWDAVQDPPVYLLEGLIPEHKVVTFFAEGGSVKTWSALSLAISVATGSAWLGKYAVRVGRVLYLDYEDGQYEFHRRVRYLTGGKDVPNLGYRYAGKQINDQNYWIELAEYCKKHEIIAVIFDSIGASMPGDADENTTAFAQGVKYAGRFTEIGCTVIFIHHANKSGGMRGTSAIRDQSDVVFKFVPVSETDDVKQMRMECEKPGPQKKPKPVNIELTDDGLGTFDDKPADAARNAFTDVDVEAAIRLALDTRGGLTNIEAVRAATKKGSKDVQVALKRMQETGEVVKIEGRFQLESDEFRTRRVFDVLSDPAIVKGFTASGKLAKQARVSTAFIDKMEAQGLICRSGDGRWMRVLKSD